MQVLTNWLRKAYYLNGGMKYRFFLSLSFSAFVFVFLFFFRPFGISAMGSMLLPTALGFAGITFLCMLVLNVVVPRFIPRFFTEENWTVGKELLYSTLNVLFIGISNAVYGIVLGLDAASGKVVVVFMLYTLGISIFPISLSILYKESRARKKYEQGSVLLNAEIETEPTPTLENIILSGQNASEQLQVSASDLLYFSAADNYVEIHYMLGTRLQKKLLRNPLKVYEEQLMAFPQFWRCHKSYLVNLDKVERVSGNAQGYRLHLQLTDETVPVSRGNNLVLKEKLKHH